MEFKGMISDGVWYKAYSPFLFKEVHYEHTHTAILEVVAWKHIVLDKQMALGFHCKQRSEKQTDGAESRKESREADSDCNGLLIDPARPPHSRHS